MCSVLLGLLRMQVLLREDRERGSGRSGLDGFLNVDRLYNPGVSGCDL